MKLRVASSWWEMVKVVLPIALLAGGAFWVAWQFVKPAPPDRVVIATGSAGGVYTAVAERYARVFNEAGVELEIRHTAGSIENWRLLLDPESGVDAAIVQGGTAPDRDQIGGRLSAVATVYLEPLWLFHRLDEEVVEMTQLAGRRVAIGPTGSGTRALATLLLRANGIDPKAKPSAAAGAANGEAAAGVDGAPAQPTRFEALGGAEAAAALKAGELDAAFFVMGPESPMLAELLADPGLKLVDFARAEAYVRRYRFLRRVTLPEGAVDLGRNLPRQDVDMVASAAAIVTKADTHHAVIQLLVRAAQRVHENGDLLAEPGEFPSDRGTEVVVSEEAEYHLHNAPNVLHRNLPFWAASLIDRMIILIIPLLVVLIPLMRITPPLYRWRIRSRIYRWYKRLRTIDERMRNDPPLAEIEADRERLGKLEREVSGVRVPLSYMEEFYNLRMHMGYLRGRLDAYVREARRHGAPSPKPRKEDA